MNKLKGRYYSFLYICRYSKNFIENNVIAFNVLFANTISDKFII